LFRTALTEFVIGRGKSLAAFVTTLFTRLLAASGTFLTPLGTVTAARIRRAAGVLAPAGRAVAGLFTGSRKAAVGAAAVMALAGIGIATIAVTTSPAGAPAAASAGRHAGTGPGHGFAVGVGDQASKPSAAASTSKPADHKAPAAKAVAHKAAAKPAHKAAPAKPAHKAAAAKPAHKAAAKPAHKPAARTPARHAVRHARASHPLTWKQIRHKLATQTYPKPAPHTLPLPDRLLPGSPSGTQSYLPVTSSRLANATTIVRQALKHHMGVRSAVIAVATAMQESTLENITYGDRDSLGLFQQRPSCGWGSAAQITNPAYAANAFLSALRSHQAADPEWASRPLWSTAQSVQNSGFPYAYAKWEAQAAQLVQRIASHLI